MQEVIGAFECANGWCNGNMFNVTWRKENCTFENGKMQLIAEYERISFIPFEE